MRNFTTGMVYGVPSQKCEKYVNKWERKSQCTVRVRVRENDGTEKRKKNTPVARLSDTECARICVPLCKRLYTSKCSDYIFTMRSLRYNSHTHTDMHIHQISAHTRKHTIIIRSIHFGLVHTDTYLLVSH